MEFSTLQLNQSNAKITQRLIFQKIQINEFNLQFQNTEDIQNLLNLIIQQPSINDPDYQLCLLASLASSIFENNYKKIPSDKLLNVLNAISFKIKNNSEEKIKEALLYGQIHLYLSRKLYKNLIEFSENDKKIKQRIEEDCKHLQRVLENSFNYFSLENTEALRLFIVLLSKLIEKSPLLFRHQTKQLENFLLNILLDQSHTQQGISINTYIPYEIEEQTFKILKLLPLAINKQAEYNDKLNTTINKYLVNLLYTFVAAQSENSEKVDEIINKLFADPNAIASIIKLEKINKYNIIRRLDIFSQLLSKVLEAIKDQCFIELDIPLFLKCFEYIIKEDQQLFYQAKMKQNTSIQMDSHFSQQEQIQISVKSKIISLNLITSIIKISGKHFNKHLDWLYDTFYFITINFETNFEIINELIKSLKNVLQHLGTEICEFVNYFLFDSLISPLNILQKYITQLNKQFRSFQDKKIKDEMQFKNQKKKNSNSQQSQQLSLEPEQSQKQKTRIQQQQQQQIQDLNFENLQKKQIYSLVLNIFKLLQNYENSIGKLAQVEQVSRVDSIFAKYLAYPKLIALLMKDKLKKVFFSSLESTLLNNHISFEESFLIADFEKFIQSYQIYETCEIFLSQAHNIKKLVYFTKSNKKISTFENILTIQHYLDSRDSNQNNDDCIQTEQPESEQNPNSSYNNNTQSQQNQYITKENFNFITPSQSETTTQINIIQNLNKDNHNVQKLHVQPAQESNRTSQDEQDLLSYKLYQHERNIEKFLYGYDNVNKKKKKLSENKFEKGSENNLIIIKDIQIANKQQEHQLLNISKKLVEGWEEHIESDDADQYEEQDEDNEISNEELLLSECDEGEEFYKQVQKMPKPYLDDNIK